MNWKAVGLTLVASFTLTACGNNGQDVGQPGVDNGVQQTRFNNTSDYPSPTGNTGNYTYPRFDGNNQEYRGMFSNNLDPRYRSDSYGVNDRNNMNNQGVNYRRNNDNDYVDRNNEIARNNEFNNRNLANNDNNDRDNDQNRFEVADQAADRIANKVNEVEEAYVLTTDNNAYVAVELDRDNNTDNDQRRNGNNGDNVSEKVEQQISRVVQSVDNDIDNVYVSTNPDFVNLTNRYVDDMNNGEPVEGFFEEFGEMIQRVFPTAR
ncbi:YhcN/YlaJ family sporulation lipoprotein [Aquibacillus sediminis]|uniref:YhcN/YlaJ family sporulation lipoprotein n=1 Tax=Aquibacillus sediminis TaxID=2574734 RepID=UPI0011098D54|nr:YhcN/YlaJ family sporulation lipoprotein [Aquibacillus sediminis]